MCGEKKQEDSKNGYSSDREQDELGSRVRV